MQPCCLTRHAASFCHVVYTVLYMHSRFLEDGQHCDGRNFIGDVMCIQTTENFNCVLEPIVASAGYVLHSYAETDHLCLNT